MSVALIIPAYNEAPSLAALAANIATLDPQPAEILLVDGGSTDTTLATAQSLGLPTLTAPKGRARQQNAAAAATRSPILLFLHADTRLPTNAVALVEQTMADPKVALAGFTAILRGPQKTRWITTAHNWLKTWYAPALFRPHLFLKGGRLLFGDHAMFVRRSAFEAIGGFDENLDVMEEADLCVRIVPHGRTRLLPQTVETSDRRIAQWGELKANWIYLKIGIRWGLGLRLKTLPKLYPDIR
ncbi:MAG: TIGR04283 family arsenosugar biosynthesis glycosyltransferase [Polymorphobacter sp.]|uniref:TIGR04283 family arsenosugar biosynthesis glycosyltransferase n=1 Tax=Polymorphobacter sp. TaxID=1909290 RepID=UPI003A8776E0